MVSTASTQAESIDFLEDECIIQQSTSPVLRYFCIAQYSRPKQRDVLSSNEHKPKQNQPHGEHYRPEPHRTFRPIRTVTDDDASEARDLNTE